MLVKEGRQQNISRKGQAIPTKQKIKRKFK